MVCISHGFDLNIRKSRINNEINTDKWKNIYETK